jgi:hypothetical protein
MTLRSLEQKVSRASTSKEAIGERHKIAGPIDVGDLDNTLVQHGAVARRAFGKANATGRNDVRSGLLQWAEFLASIIQISFTVQVNVEEVAHDGLLFLSNDEGFNVVANGA